MTGADRPPAERDGADGTAEDRTARAGLDDRVFGERPCTRVTSNGDGPLTVHVQVRIAVGGHADAVAAAQGDALRGLLAALGHQTARPSATDDTRGEQR